MAYQVFLLVFNKCFSPQLRYRKPAKISLHFALGAQDMDTTAPLFTGDWPI